ncbi:Aste57867_14689 [Aphanomyces stellatus]|uniref:Aste57867_14689 protein n=1 Tax=Aphanomyces stellatus TaxID=120398 RepID=A0A485L1W3_9STRA|nr:hypothetical protein As57867_014634 [Aphanomyces stellatus]VFT91507.1 Aste57867_14689 [Aphanomyces stellatus]
MVAVVVANEENVDRKCAWRVTVEDVVLTQNFFGGVDNATGGALWDASLVLWQVMKSRNDHNFCGKRVLELGAGVGFLAVKMAQDGAKVVATDGDLDTVALLQENVKQNNVTDGVAAAPLFWGDAVSYTKLKAVYSDPFDYVVGADVIYFAGDHGELLETLCDVCNDATVVFLSYRLRHPDKEEAFLESVQDHFKILTMQEVDATGVYFVELMRRHRCVL